MNIKPKVIPANDVVGYDSLARFTHYKLDDANCIILVSAQLQLVDDEADEDFCPALGEELVVCSKCMPDQFLEPDEVIIKAYSENEGMDTLLIEAGIIGPVKRYITSGFVLLSVHDILVENREDWNNKVDDLLIALSPLTQKTN